MKGHWESEENVSSALIPWKGKPISDPAQPQAHNPFAQTLINLWYFLKGYTAGDIGRLKEAGVRQVEGKAARDHAEAEERIAMAAKAHAEARAIDKKSEHDALLSKIEAIERLEAVISRIRQNGGDVAFDASELRKQILTAGIDIDTGQVVYKPKADLPK